MATHWLWNFLLCLTDKSIGHFICLAFQDILTHYFRLYTKFWLSLLAFLGLCQLDFSHAEKKSKSNYYPLTFDKRIASLSLYRRGPVLVSSPQSQTKLSRFKMHFKRWCITWSVRYFVNSFVKVHVPASEGRYIDIFVDFGIQYDCWNSEKDSKRNWMGAWLYPRKWPHSLWSVLQSVSFAVLTDVCLLLGGTHVIQI